MDYDVPAEIDYNLTLLEEFVQKDPEPALIFYGGEPMLCIPQVRQIMDHIEAKQFNIQTNGVHLNKLEPKYVNRFTTIFVSIDGTEEVTDYYRGNGVYKKVTQNIRTIIENGFEGEVIARMTLMEETDFYPSIKWLLNNPDFSYTSIHWQLDAGFWKSDFKKRNFEQWLNKSYNPSIEKLVKFWVDHMETEGKVIKLYPLLGITQSLLLKEVSRLRCGSGWCNYSIQTDGHIIPCPSMSGMQDYYLGHIKDAHPLRLKQVHVGEPCTSCQIYSQCGGRCLYANITKQWNSKQYNLVCSSVENLVKLLKAYLPRIEELIKTGKIGLSDFSHQKYNSCEIIP